MGWVSLVKSLSGRLVLLTHGLLVIGYTYLILGNQLLNLLFLIPVALQVFEAFWIIFRKKCKEYAWFSSSAVCYLIVAVPPIWVAEIKFLLACQHNSTETNVTMLCNRRTNALRDINGFDDRGLPISIDDSLGMDVLKQTLLFAIMVNRWLIPRGSMTRSALSNLLFIFFALASDIMELFDLFEEEGVRQHCCIGYAILSFWTASLVQMTLSLVNRAKLAGESWNKNETEEASPDDRICCHSSQITDILFVVFSLFTMDVPFLVIRLVVIVHLQVYTYGIFFFTSKNILVIILGIYRLTIICRTKRKKIWQAMTVEMQHLKDSTSSKINRIRKTVRFTDSVRREKENTNGFVANKKNHFDSTDSGKINAGLDFHDENSSNDKKDSVESAEVNDTVLKEYITANTDLDLLYSSKMRKESVTFA